MVVEIDSQKRLHVSWDKLLTTHDADEACSIDICCRNPQV